MARGAAPLTNECIPGIVSTRTDSPSCSARRRRKLPLKLDWIVTQLGAREHYAIPRALARTGQLKCFYTDAWCTWGRSLLQRGPSLTRALANRYHEDLSAESVTAFNSMAITNVLRRSLIEWKGGKDALAWHHADAGRRFAHAVVHSLRKRDLSSGQPAFFGFSVGSLEVLSHLQTCAIPTVVDQISPGPLETQIVAREAQEWPKWVHDIPSSQPVLEDRVAHEWELADLVLVNSSWSKQALEREGVPPEKIIVIPSAYESSVSPEVRNGLRTGPLQVLWLGNVILRKGIHYLVQAAKQLRAADVQFQVVGPIGITDYAVNQAPENMTFHGPVSRNRVSDFYHDADVFILPTLSDGFGLTQLEAMAHGCPVIATPNCGRVVVDGENGFVIPPRDPEAIVEVIEWVLRHRNVVSKLSRAAIATVENYSLHAYAERLSRAVTLRSPFGS